MTRTGDWFVRVCKSVHTFPAAFLCVILFMTQAGIMDYFLIEYISILHLAWIGVDVLNLVILISSICVSYSILYKDGQTHTVHGFAWLSWLLMNIVVAGKIIIIFNMIATDLTDDNLSFFGPNTLKTSIALESCVFLSLLITQHDAALGSERKLYIEELTGYVVFDLIDTVDILEILYNKNMTASFWPGLFEFILAVATINLLIPTVPLLVLSRTSYGHFRLQKHVVYLHKLLLIMSVNVPNLVVRFILWHGFSGAISPFSLKNIILISLTLYEFYLHKKAKYEEHEKELNGMKRSSDNHSQLSGKTSYSLDGKVGVTDNCEPNNETRFENETKIEIHL